MKIDYSLYLVTDSSLMKYNKLEDAVEDAIKGGVSIVQLREKNISTLNFYNLGQNIRKITKKYNIPFIINDRLDIALALDSDGLHIGQDDMPLKIARKIFGKNKIIGVSASNLQQAIQAEKDGADYLGVGAMYSQNTKKDADLTTMEELKAIRKAVKIPIVVIGGINENTIPNFRNLNIDGYAVVSAIMSKENTKTASENLKELILKN